MADTTGEPVLCNCGFYGNPQFDNLCSKCYKEKQKQLQQQKGGEDAPAAPAPASPAVAVSVPVAAAPSAPVAAAPPAIEIRAPEPSPSIPIPTAVQPASDDSKPGSLGVSASVSPVGSPSDAAAGGEKKKNKCATCGIKITFSKLTTNKCKCGNVYCDKHRMATAHECSFDWKGTGRAKIEQELEKNREKKSGGRSFTRLESNS